MLSPQLQNNILQLIENKVFLGKYAERRYVDSLQAYRDIIIIESNEVIVDNLMKVKKLLETSEGNKKWVGISNDPQNSESNNCLLWVQIKNVPIGKHWFQMSAIHFEEKEIILEVQHIQSYQAPDRSFNINDTDFPSFDLKEILTYSNIRESFKFMAILFMTLVTFFIEVVKYLSDYSIKLSHVIIQLVHVSTPICSMIFEFFTKCVLGLYWLIYVMFRGNGNTPVVPAALMSNQKQISYRPTYRHYAYPNVLDRYKYKKN